MQKREAGAYLTVYAALSMAVLLSLFLAVLEGVRVNTIQLEAELIADIALDSVLAEYHRELLNQYGMFWIDTSYGSAQPSVQALEEHLKYYVNQNCAMDEVLLGDYLYRDFLAMEVGELTVLKAAVAGDDKGRLFRERAVEVVKDDIGLALLEQIADWLETVELHGLGAGELEQEMQQVDNEIMDYDGREIQVGEEWITLEVESPVKILEEARRKGVLNLVIDNMEELSEAAVNTASLISSRRETDGINQGNWEEWEEQSSGADALIQRLLWQEYLLRYCSFYGSEPEKGLLQYQVEYLIAGKDNDIDNLKNVVHRICGIREAANALYLFSDETKCAEAEAAAAVISAALLIPEAEPLFRTAILLGWAYAESLYDVRCLLKGQRIPLLKSAETWHYGLEGALKAVQDTESIEYGEEADAGSGLAYKDYLRLLLAFPDLEAQTFRMMDIVEMDIRQTPGNGQFRLDGCIDRLEAEICVESAYGYSFHINKRKKY